MTDFKPWRLALAAAVIAFGGLIVWRLFESNPAEPSAPPTTAQVSLAPVMSGQIAETIAAYGVVTGSPDATRTIASPGAVVVDQILVRAGQTVAAGARLIQLRRTPAGALALDQAHNAEAFAQNDLARVQRLADDHLAANDQLLAARRALADARAAVVAQTALGAGQKTQTITAPFAGIVASIPVTAGDHVAPDAALLSLVRSGGMTAQLGVEPSRSGRLAIGQSVSLRILAEDAPAFAGRVDTVSHQIDPTTRMISFTAPIGSASAALGAAVEAVVTVNAHPGQTVPRKALVYDEDGVHLFLIQNGKALRVPVTAGTETGDAVSVTGALPPGAMVAVEGAYELQDGMAVRVRRP